ACLRARRNPRTEPGRQYRCKRRRPRGRCGGRSALDRSANRAAWRRLVADLLYGQFERGWFLYGVVGRPKGFAALMGATGVARMESRPTLQSAKLHPGHGLLLGAQAMLNPPSIRADARSLPSDRPPSW